MKKFACAFLIIILCKNILIANPAQASKSEEKFVEIQKCIFLEKQLIPPPKNLTLVRKIFKITYPAVISVLIAHIIYKALGFVTKATPQKTTDQVQPPYYQKLKQYADALRKLSQNSPEEIKIPANSNVQNKPETKDPYDLSLVFAIATPIYLLIKFLAREKELTQLQILTNFIKDWQNNKTDTPTKFHQRFNYLHQVYENNTSLNLTEQEAERIILTTTMETIDYKIQQQSNYANLSSTKII